MKAIEYSINSSLPPTKPGYSIDNIQSKNRDYFATFEGHSAAIELEFPPCVISSIHIGFMTSTNLRILAYSLPDKSDAVDLIEKRIPYLKESCNACVFNSDQNFPNHSSRVFSGVRVEIENLEERRPFNLNYITLMTPKENIMGTPSPSPGPRTNFYRASFTTPNNSKPKQAPKESSEKSLKQSTLSNFVGMGPSNDNEVLVVGNSVEENLLHTPEIAKQQSRLLSSFKKTQNTTSATRKKKLTNSYAELLSGYIISCFLEDEMMKYEVMQLCDVLGAVFVEEPTDRLTYVIADGSNMEALEKLREDEMHIVSIEWLRECLIKKELVPSEIYSLY